MTTQRDRAVTDGQIIAARSAYWRILRGLAPERDTLQVLLERMADEDRYFAALRRRAAMGDARLAEAAADEHRPAREAWEAAQMAYHSLRTERLGAIEHIACAMRTADELRVELARTRPALDAPAGWGRRRGETDEELGARWRTTPEGVAQSATRAARALEIERELAGRIG